MHQKICLINYLCFMTCHLVTVHHLSGYSKETEKLFRKIVDNAAVVFQYKYDYIFICLTLKIQFE